MAGFCEGCGIRIRDGQPECHVCGRNTGADRERRTAEERREDLFGICAASFVMSCLWGILAIHSLLFCGLLGIGIAVEGVLTAAHVPSRLKAGVIGSNVLLFGALLGAQILAGQSPWPARAVCLSGVLVNAAWLWATRRPERWITPPGCCRHCGYNLTGLPRPRCPECGTWFDPSREVPVHRDPRG